MQRFVKADLEPSTHIGSGAYGHVYKAKHKKLGNVVYKALIKPDDMRELIHAQRMFEHENIVKIYGFLFNDTDDNIPKGYVMELHDTTLHTVIYNDCESSLPFYTRYKAVLTFFKICDGLEALHSKRILHRDVKPSNILVSENLSTVKLCDFGTCSADSVAKTTAVGTIFYMAPEVAKISDASGSVYTEKCDVYSAAILFFEIFYRRKPYETSGLNLLKEVATGRRQSLESPDLRKDLKLLINKAWHADPEERPSISQFRLELMGVITCCLAELSSCHKTKILNGAEKSSMMHAALVNVFPDRELLLAQVLNSQALYGISLPFHESELGDRSTIRGTSAQMYYRQQQHVLLKELGILSKVQSHPNITSVHALIFNSLSENPIGYIFERMDTSLEHALRDQSITLSLKQGLTIIYQTSKVIDYLHDEGVVHGDIRSNNVRVSSNFRNIKLGGFEASDSRAKVFNDNENTIEQKTRLWNDEVSQDVTAAVQLFLDVILRSRADEQPESSNKKVGPSLMERLILVTKICDMGRHFYVAVAPPMKDIVSAIDETMKTGNRDGLIYVFKSIMHIKLEKNVTYDQLKSLQ